MEVASAAPVAEAERALEDALDDLYWAGEKAERVSDEQHTQGQFNKAAWAASRTHVKAMTLARRYAALRALAEVQNFVRLVNTRAEETMLTTHTLEGAHKAALDIELTALREAQKEE